jgi:hypothetical protein
MGSPQLRGRLENFKTIATFRVYLALTLNSAFLADAAKTSSCDLSQNGFASAPRDTFLPT